MNELDLKNMNLKIKEMALIFANLKEVENLINKQLPSENIEPTKYYLLPKEWVDNYKNKYNYDSVISGINVYALNDYTSFKSLLEDEISFKSILGNPSIQINSEIELELPIPSYLQDLSSSINEKICFPRNFVPIREEIINEYTCLDFNIYNKKLFLYDIIIGEENIYVLDNNNKLNLFICKYEKENEYFNPIKLLSFLEEKTFDEMIKCIFDKNRTNNYFKEKKINEKGEIEQEICDNKGSLIGSGFELFQSINNDNIPKVNEEGKTLIINNRNNEKGFKFMDSIIKEPTVINKIENNENNKNNNIIKNENEIKNIDGNNDNFNDVSINALMGPEYETEIIEKYNLNPKSKINTKINKKDTEFKEKLNSIQEESNEDFKSFMGVESQSAISNKKSSQNYNSQKQSTNESSMVENNPNYQINDNNNNKKEYIYNIVGDLYCFSRRKFINNYQNNNLKNDLIISELEINKIPKRENKYMNNNYINNNTNEQNNITNVVLNKLESHSLNYQMGNNGNININMNNSDLNINKINNFSDNIKMRNLDTMYNFNNNGNINNININNGNGMMNDSNQMNINNTLNSYSYKQCNTNYNNPNNNNFDYNQNDFNNININNFNQTNYNRTNPMNFNVNNPMNINNFNNNEIIYNNNDNNFNNQIFNNNQTMNINTNYSNYNQRFNNYYNINNPNMNYINNFGNNNTDRNLFNSKTYDIDNRYNYNNLNNNNICKKYKFSLKESVIDKDFTLTLSSDQLNRSTHIIVKKDDKLKDIINSYKTEAWVKQYPIENIKLNGEILDMNKTLDELNIFMDTGIKIYFKEQNNYM